MADKFNLAALLAEVSEPDTGREQIEYIPLDLLDSDPNNFYELTDIPALADNIALCNLQQPIRVRQQENGRYMIVSGHRRRAALEMLVSDGYEKFREAPCIVEKDEVSSSLQQLRLIYANAATRKLTAAEISEQAVQVEKLLYQLKEEGYEFPGRMRDHVAQAVSVSKTKLARLKVIRDNLAKCWQTSYKRNELVEATAYNLAQLPEEWQQIIHRHWKDKPIQLHADYVTAFRDRMNCISKIKCTRNGREKECIHGQTVMMDHAVADRWAYSCVGDCCCTCSSLLSCKFSCHLAAGKKTQLQTERREERRQQKAEEDARNQTIVDRLNTIYRRLGQARKDAGLSVEDYYRAVDRYYSAKEEATHLNREAGYAKMNENILLPFGQSFYHHHAKALCDAADALGCSIDFLLGRTDAPQPTGPLDPVAPAEVSEDVIPKPCVWYPKSVEPPIGQNIVVWDDTGFADEGTYLGLGQLDEACVALWKDVLYWTLPPGKKDVADASVSYLGTGWQTGYPWNFGEYVVLVRYDSAKNPTPEKMHWTEDGWEMLGVSFDETCPDAVIVGWMPMPEGDGYGD